jgi:hypothetical protein
VAEGKETRGVVPTWEFVSAWDLRVSSNLKRGRLLVPLWSFVQAGQVGRRVEDFVGRRVEDLAP